LDNTQEFFLQDKFRTTNADYICAGYEKDFPHVNLRADLTDLPFRDSLFDLAIVCHILEHIPDDLRALSELYRVLNSEGSLIIIIPYKADLATLEQHTSSKNERKLLYGDENHYRVYGNDFENKLIKAGFGLKDIPKCSDYKLNGGERAFVCSKLLKISS
jgi:SAM-dependent methyltransferase